MLNEKFINADSGEICYGADIFSICYNNYIIEGQRKQERRERGLRCYKSKDEFYNYINNHYGDFFINNYNCSIDKFYIDNKFESGMLFRFLYLCTYMDYDNRLRFGGKFKNKNRAYMNENDLQEVLNLSVRESINTKKFLYKIGVLIKQEDGLCINLKLTKKGKLPNSYKHNSTRVFNDALKEIYENSRAVEHKRLGILFRILPFINYKHNILCENPNEDCIKNIIPLEIKQICKMVGYSEKNHHRLKKDLFRIKVRGKFAVGAFEKHNMTIIVINPAVYYAGNKIDELKAINTLFSVQ